MKTLLVTLMICCSALVCFSQETDFPETPPPEGLVRGIAEFEPCQGVLVKFVGTEPGLEFAVPVELIAAMSEVVDVTTIVRDQAEEDYALGVFEVSDVNVANCSFIHSPIGPAGLWVRDYGPWFISVDNRLAVVNAAYSSKASLAGCNEFPILFAEWMGLDWYGMKLFYDGGNFMADGLGVAVATDLVWNRNGAGYGTQADPETRSAIAQTVKDYLGISTFYVIDDPLVPNTSFHIDCSAKFLDVDKILIAQVPLDDPQYGECEAAAEYWANQKSSWGSPYQIFRVDASDWHMTYTNSLILNDHVFVPLVDFEELDELNEVALAVYEAAMPGYTVVGVPSLYHWYESDALHCRTHEVPDSNMLYVHHMPLWGEVAYQTECTVTAEIVPFSRQPVTTASVFYRVDGGPYVELSMEWVEGNTYAATLPEQVSGTVVAYYIHAVDASGKTANHPFIGAPDPHRFTVGPVANDSVETGS